jgi:3-methyladenine DNA glycosylase AlkD
MSNNIKIDKTVLSFQQALLPLANAERAIAMRAYMKEHCHFLGIPAPERRKATMPLIRALKPINDKKIVELVEALWQLSEREYHYLAIDLLAHYHRQIGVEYVPQLLDLAQHKSWWDSVDGIAGVIGDVLKNNLTQDKHGQELMDVALTHHNLWVRRIALLHQLGWREKTDIKRLTSYVLTLAHQEEFFIRKAIGWALRDYAWYDPEYIRQFLLANQNNISKLSFREAAKHII